jgi:hypothetical protein
LTPIAQIGGLLDLELVPRRQWRYWAADRGLFTYASRVGGPFLKGVARLCRTALSTGAKNPLSDLIDKPPDQEPQEVLAAISDVIASDDQAREQWSRIMKTLFDGVVDSLPLLLGHPPTVTRTFYPQGEAVGDLTIAAPTIVVPEASCIPLPMAGDQIRIKGRVFRVESVATASPDVMIQATSV